MIMLSIILVPILMNSSVMSSSTLTTAAADRGIVWMTGGGLVHAIIGSSFSAGGMKASDGVANRGDIFFRIAFRTDSWLRGMTTRPSLILFNSL